MFFNWNFCASDLHIRIASKGTFQNVNSAGAATSSPISTLMHPVSLKTQNMKVVEICLGVPWHIESSQSERGRESYAQITKQCQSCPESPN